MLQFQSCNTQYNVPQLVFYVTFYRFLHSDLLNQYMETEIGAKTAQIK